MQFATGSYTGNGVDNRWINNPGFEPDLVIIKADAPQCAVWRSSTMEAGESAYFSQYIANFTNAIQAFGANGFQVGTDKVVNANGVTYYWAAFRDDRTNDFHVGSYTGDGSANRNITGLGFTPTIVWIKRDGEQDGVWRVDENKGDACLRCIERANCVNHIQCFVNDGFQIGSSSKVNASGRTYHYVAFCDVSECIETGLYTGDDNDDRDIIVGFPPDLVFVKGDTAQHGVLRIDTMKAGDSGPFTSLASGTNQIRGFEAEGFKVGTHARVNSNGLDYYWAAWKTGTTTSFSSSSSSSSSSILPQSTSTSTSTSTSSSSSSSSFSSSSSSSSKSSSSSSSSIPPIKELLALLDEMDRLSRLLREKITTM